jgi:ABC-type Mn2+/Zn2+ transport system permease subunit
MEETEIIPQSEADNSWKAKTLVIGGVIGALVGVGGAFLLVRRSEQQGKPLSISTGRGVQLGMLVAGLLRSILSLGDG